MTAQTASKPFRRPYHRKLDSHYRERGGLIRFVFSLYDLGYTYGEIAEAIKRDTGVTLHPGTLRGNMLRWRKHLEATTEEQANG